MITMAEMQDEMARIVLTYVAGLSTREQAVESLGKVDPVARAYVAPDAYLESLGL